MDRLDYETSMSIPFLKPEKALPDPILQSVCLNQITIDPSSELSRIAKDMRYMPNKRPLLTPRLLECITHVLPLCVVGTNTKKKPDTYSLVSGFGTFQLLGEYLGPDYESKVNYYKKLDFNQKKQLQATDLILSKVLFGPNSLGISILAEALHPDSPAKSFIDDLINLKNNENRAEFLGISVRDYLNRVKEVRLGRTAGLITNTKVVETISLGLPMSVEGGKDE